MTLRLAPSPPISSSPLVGGSRRRLFASTVFVLLCLAPAIASLSMGPPAKAATTYTITRNVPAGLEPTGVALDSLHRRQFVQNGVLGSGVAAITVIDDVTGTVTNTLPTALRPVDLALAANAGLLYVAERGASGSGVLSPEGLGEIAISQVYVGGRVEIFDTTTHELASTIHLPGYQPNAVALDPAMNRVYVAADPVAIASGPTVLAIDLATLEIQRQYSITGSPKSLAVDPMTHRVYVASPNPLSSPVLPLPGILTVIQPDAEAFTLATIPVGVDPIDVSLDLVNGRAYVVNGTSQSVTVLNLATNQVFRTVSVAGARQVAVDPVVGEIYVTGYDQNNVVVLRAGDLATLATIGVGGTPEGVAVDAIAHRAFVTTAVGGRLITISRQVSAAPTTTIGPGPVTTFPVPVATTVPVVTTRAAPTTVAAATSVVSTTIRTTTTVGSPTAATPRAVATTIARSQKAAAQFIEAVPSPGETRTEVGELAKDAFLAILFLALLSLPINVVNGIAETNAEILAARAAGIGQRIRVTGLGARVANLPLGVVLLVAAVVSAVLYGFLQPSFGLDEPSLALVLGVTIAVLILNVVQRLSQMSFLSRAYNANAYLRLLPGFLVVALACVVISRLVGLQPGLLLGPLATVGLREQLSREDQGKALAIAYASVAAFGLVAWVSRSTVLGAFDPGSLAGEVTGVAWTTLVIASTETVAFNMIPLRFLDGSQVFAWSKAAWAALSAFGLFGFVHVLIHPDSGAGSFADRTAYLGILLVVYLVLAAAFWAFFRFRAAPDAPPPPQAEPSAQTPSPSAVQSEDSMQAAWRTTQGSGWPTSRG